MTEQTKAHRFRDMQKILVAEFTPYKWPLVLSALLAAVTSISEVVVVYLIAALGTAVLSGSDQPIVLPAGLEASRTVVAYAAVIAVLARGVVQLVSVQIQQRTIARFEHGSRSQLLSMFLDAEWSIQASMESTDVYNAVFNFLVQARTALQYLVNSTTAGVSFAVMLVGSIAIGGWWALAILGGSAALALAFRPLVRSTHRAGHASRVASRRFVEVMVETISLARESRVFASDEAMKERDRVASAEWARTNQQAGLATGRLSSLYSTATYTVAAVGLVMVVVLDLSNPAAFMTVVLLLYRGLGYGQGLQGAYQNLVGNVPGIQALQTRRAELARAALPAGGFKFVPPIEEIRFESVSFSYDNRAAALTDIDLRIGRGQALGIVGPSGSGKSTLVDLLLRLQLPTAGKILVNGTDLAGIDPRTWFGHVVLVPQDAGLLNASVLENVLWFRTDLSREQAIEAMRAASILEEMLALPEGLDTSVGEAGGRLSGGQRQRLCIARALVGSPDVLVLDEPTSALDLISEEAFRNTLESLRGKLTLVVIAHRLSTLRSCDRVMVLGSGKVEAIGDRSVLEADSAFFAEAVRLSRLG